MVTCHFNFQFQVLVLLKGIKELGVVHYIVDLPSIKMCRCLHTSKAKFNVLGVLLVKHDEISMRTWGTQ